jgi:type IV pilus assembly protein PilW
MEQAPCCNGVRSQYGFTLIEILVGMAIGMVLTVVIIEVMSVFENQARTTSGTADAQTNGSIALFTISRELASAGYGLYPANASPYECTSLNINGAVDATVPNRLTPVTITNGTTAAGDTVVIRYATGNFGGIAATINSVGSPSADDVSTSTNFACNSSDVSLVTNGATCSMSTVVSTSGTKSIKLAHMTGTAVNANITCLGAWNEVTFRVNNATLERNGVALLPGIVSLQAQYGVSADAKSNVVAQWVNASGSPWSAPTAADRNRIKAIRLAVIGRNDKLEPNPPVTTACSSTTAASTTGLCAWPGTVASPAPVVDLSADPNWNRYRYRVFETIVPLRNVVWARSTL